MNPDPSKSYREVFEVNYGVRIPGPIKLLIWSIAIATVIGLTIKDFYTLISEYRDNNVATQVQVVLLDDQFTPPQMVLSIPRGKYRNKHGDDLMILAVSLYENNGTCGPEAQEICDNLTTAYWDVWNGRVQKFNSTSLDTVYGDLSLAFTEKIFTDPTSDDIFDEQFSSWNEAIISSFMNYIAWFLWPDYNLSPSPPDRNIRFNRFPASDIQKKTEDFDSKFEVLFNRMLNFLCSRINYTELYYRDEYSPPVTVDRSCSDLLLNSTAPVFVGAALSFAFPAVKIPIIKEYRFSITRSLRNSSLLANVSADPLSTVVLFADAGCLYATSFDQIYTPRLYEFPVAKENQTGTKITVKYKVQMRARETRPIKASCVNGTSATTCFVQCTKLWVIDKCKCVPFKVRKGLEYPNMESVPYCDPAAYAKCKITVIPKAVTDQCVAQCQRPCDYTIYSWQISHEAFKPQQTDVSEFIIRMVPQFDTFTEFNWIIKDTPEQFFSQLAGIGSFYLGFSGLSIFSIFIWCLDRRKFVRKRQGEPAGNDRKGKNVTPVDEGKWANDDGWCKSCSCRRSIEEWLLEREAKLHAQLREEITMSLSAKTASRNGGFQF